MKALSLTQPMAWAIFHGKDVENRNWNTHYRGPLLIHASKGFNRKHYDWIAANENVLACILPQPDELVHGALIGIVNLTRVMIKEVKQEPWLRHDVSIGDQQRELEYFNKDSAFCSHWFFGPYGFVLEGAREFCEPVPYRGQLGFFDVPDEVYFEIDKFKIIGNIYENPELLKPSPSVLKPPDLSLDEGAKWDESVL